MRSKIFKQTLYSLLMVLGIHTIARSQTTPPAATKTMEEKMEQMELKLKQMQAKLDSMKILNGREIKALSVNGQLFDTRGLAVISDTSIKTIRINGQTMNEKSLKLLRALPPRGAVGVTPPATVQGFSYNYNGNKATALTLSPAYKMSGISLTKKLSDAEAEKRLQEKIKSGEVKQKLRTLTKEYKIKSGDKLQIDNRFGKVTVNTWNKNEFKIEVEIKAIANEEDDAQKLLDAISIVDGTEGSVITLTTKIESQNQSRMWGSWSNGGKSYYNKSEVNYTVYMPSKNSLEIKNRFGAITVPDFGGKLSINSQYGSFTAKDLTNIDNDITTRFTDVYIGSINGSTLNCQYGNGGEGIKIGNANNLKLDAQFIDADIAKIRTAGNISVRYGNGLKINELDKNVKVLNINSSFAPVTMGSKGNFDFSVAVKMGGDFKYDDDRVKITKSPDDSRRFSVSKVYTGYTGKANSDTKVTITNSYKGVEFL